MKYPIIIIIMLMTIASCKPKTKSTLEQLKEDKANFEKLVMSYNDSIKFVKKKIKALDTNKIEGAKVRVSSITETPFSEIIKLQGSVKADKNVLVSPQIGGIIKRIYVKEGQYVSAGKTLASIDSDIINQSTREIEKALELANYVFEKQRNLKTEGVGTELQYQQAKNQKESLERKLKTLRTQASKSRVVAPISGYVDKILPNQGEMATPQMPMFRILNLNKISVIVDVSENYMTHIKNGKKVSINFPSINKRIDNLSISRTSKYINPANRTYQVQIDINNRNVSVPVNMLAEVSITKSFKENAIVIPSKSVFEDNKGNKFIYLMVNNKAVKKTILVDFVEGNKTQVNDKSGIKKGDIVIVDGASVLENGDFVEIL